MLALTLEQGQTTGAFQPLAAISIRNNRLQSRSQRKPQTMTVSVDEPSRSISGANQSRELANNSQRER